MVTVKLSDKPCDLCASKDDTMHAKKKDFQAVLCHKHLVGLMKKWEETSEAGAAIPAKV